MRNNESALIRAQKRTDPSLENFARLVHAAEYLSALLGAKDAGEAVEEIPALI